MNDLALEIFGPTICTRWNSQSFKLKEELMNRSVHLFGEGTFSKSRVVSKVGLYLKYIQEQYNIPLQKNPKYELPPMIPEVKWKGLMADANEKKL